MPINSVEQAGRFHALPPSPLCTARTPPLPVSHQTRGAISHTEPHAPTTTRATVALHGHMQWPARERRKERGILGWVLLFYFTFFCNFFQQHRPAAGLPHMQHVDFPPRTVPTRWPTITMQHEAMNTHAWWLGCLGNHIAA